MRPFDFHEPATLREAIALLQDSTEAVPMGGGAVLTFLMQQRLVSPARVVGLNAIPELRGIIIRDGTVRIGATSTLRQVEQSPAVKEHLPVLAEAARLVGNVRVRNVATVGGHVAQADIHQDLPPVLAALNATVELAGPGRTRSLPIGDFLVGYYETALGPAELVTAITVPIPAPGSHGVYLKYSALSQHDWPALGVCALGRGVDGRLRDVRIVAGAVSDRPLRLPDAETAFEEGAALDDIGRRYAAAANPVEDAQGSAAYKRHVLAVHVARALDAVAGRAGVTL